MNVPRISGVLNNCPLHILIPQLSDEIIAIGEKRSELTTDLSTYDLLKKKFAEFYNLDSTLLTWQAFSSILLKIDNPFDRQMLLGPVLRLVLAEQMRNMTEETAILHAQAEYAEMTIEGFIAHKTAIQNDGRYTSLSPDEVFLFLAQPFGLQLIYHREGEGVPQTFNGNLPTTAPKITIFHQGGVEGAGAGGHFELTDLEIDRIDYEQASNTHLRVVAELMRQDSLATTQIGLELLFMYMSIITNSTDEEEREAMFDTLDLTVAQVEKYLYNRLFVKPENAKRLLREITSEADYLIAQIPPVENLPYDLALSRLVEYHFNMENEALKQDLTEQQYEIALALLTPPTIQEQAHRVSTNRIWALQANEISELATVRLAQDFAERIIFAQGLSDRLYALCNRDDIANGLSSEFLDILSKDVAFEQRASAILKSAVLSKDSTRTPVSKRPTHVLPTMQKLMRSNEKPRTPCLTDIYGEGEGEDRIQQYQSNSLATYVSPKREGSFNDDFSSPCPGRDLFGADCDSDCETDADSRAEPSGESDVKHADLSSTSVGTPQVNAGQSLNSEPPSTNWSAQFWLQAIQISLGVGCVCTVITLITCPPVAAALGLTTVFGVATADVCATVGYVAGTSLLLAAGFFAAKAMLGEQALPSTQNRAAMK